MKQLNFKIITVFLLQILSITYSLSQQKIVKNNKIFIEHTVEAKETLYSISRKYDISVNEIKAVNGEVETLSIGQKILVPTNEKVPQTLQTNSKPELKFHTVEGGETLFKIAQLYHITTEEIIEWNGLKDNNINIGQKLIVKAPSGKSDTRIPATKEKPQQITPQKETVIADIVEPKKKVVVQIVENSAHKKTEKGDVSIISDPKYNSKFAYCLHKTAKTGTLVKIVNEANGTQVWARVLGNFPIDDPTILKVNSTVFKVLKGSNSTINATISYRL